MTTGLTGKLLLLTIAFVLVAELLIFIPSIANMRLAWLNDRLSTAESVGAVIDGLQADLPAEVQDATLQSMDAILIVLSQNDKSRMLAAISRPPNVDVVYDLRDVGEFGQVYDALEILFNSTPRVMRVMDNTMSGNAVIELVMPTTGLRDAMLGYVSSIALVSLFFAVLITIVIFVSFNQLFIVPIKRLTHSMESFSQKPDDATRIYRPHAGGDELAVAGRQLAGMQETVHHALKQRAKLVDLGLAVSKINHDLRNVLSSAQLLSDRLVDVKEPIVRSFAPRLIRTLDRAVSYTNELLSYGQMQERLPKRQPVDLSQLVLEVREFVLTGKSPAIEFVVKVDDGLMVCADSEQLFRVIFNLCRNAVQALEQEDASLNAHKQICVSGEHHDGVATIIIDDNGPGMPLKARQNLFSAFRGSARAGGTGLGLVIVRELILAHGGTVALIEKATKGTQFRIEIPDEHKIVNQFS